MIKYKIIISGEPLGKQSVRSTVRGGFVRQYTPAKTVNYMNLIKEIFMQTYPEAIPLNQEIALEINAYFSIPKTLSNKKKELCLSGIERPKKKPDCDNIAKTVGDALNKIAWTDDSHIISLTVNKYFSEKPRLEITITSLKE